MRTCPQCGKKLAGNLEYCDSCGYAFSEDSELMSTAPNDTNPYAFVSRTEERSSELEEARVVPTNMIETIHLCFNQGGAAGRSSRAEFWLWVMSLCVAAVFPIGVCVWWKTTTYDDLPEGLLVIFCVSSIWGVICLVPSVTLCVRRFHDVGLSGTPLVLLLVLSALAFMLASLRIDFFTTVASEVMLCATFVGFWALIVVVALIPGTAGKNRYGPTPERRRKDSSKSKSLDDSLTPKNNEASR